MFVFYCPNNTGSSSSFHVLVFILHSRTFSMFSVYFLQFSSYRKQFYNNILVTIHFMYVCVCLCVRILTYFFFEILLCQFLDFFLFVFNFSCDVQNMKSLFIRDVVTTILFNLCEFWISWRVHSIYVMLIVFLYILSLDFECSCY